MITSIDLSQTIFAIDMLTALKSSLVDDIYVRFGEQLLQQMVGMSLGTNCSPLLAELFLHSFENEVSDKLFNEGKRKLPIETSNLISLY